MERHLLHSVILYVATEMTRTGIAVAGSYHHLSSTFQHVAPNIIEIRTRNVARTPHHDIIRRIGTVTAGAMSAEKVIPSVAIYEIGSLAIYRHIYRLITLHALTRGRVELHDTDKTEIRAVREPQTSGSRVEQQSGINSIAILIIERTRHLDRLRKLEVGRVRVKSLVPHRQHLTGMTAAQTATGGTVCHKITVANLYRIGCGTPTGTHRAASPRPAVVRYQTTSPGAKRIVFPVALHDRRWVVDIWCAIQGKCRDSGCHCQKSAQ